MTGYDRRIRGDTENNNDRIGRILTTLLPCNAKPYLYDRDPLDLSVIPMNNPRALSPHISANDGSYAIGYTARHRHVQNTFINPSVSSSTLVTRSTHKTRSFSFNAAIISSSVGGLPTIPLHPALATICDTQGSKCACVLARSLLGVRM